MYVHVKAWYPDPACDTVQGLLQGTCILEMA